MLNMCYNSIIMVQNGPENQNNIVPITSRLPDQKSVTSIPDNSTTARIIAMHNRADGRQDSVAADHVRLPSYGGASVIDFRSRHENEQKHIPAASTLSQRLGRFAMLGQQLSETVGRHKENVKDAAAIIKDIGGNAKTYFALKNAPNTYDPKDHIGHTRRFGADQPLSAAERAQKRWQQPNNSADADGSTPPQNDPVA
jgi:rhodanese-related sulfurtransferase